MFFNLPKIVEKKSAQRKHLKKQMTISIWTPGGSDGCPTVLELANYVTETFKEKVALVEFPCLGIPRLAIHVNLYDKEKNTDKLLLDIERLEDKEIYPVQYFLKVSDLKWVLPINPYAASDLAIHLKLNNLKTLTDFPGYLKNNLSLEGYKLIIYILQGQIHHPLTFFGIKESDLVLLNVNSPIELGWALNCCHKLISNYHQLNHKFAVYAPILDNKTIAGITQVKYLYALDSIFAEEEDY